MKTNISTNLVKHIRQVLVFLGVFVAPSLMAQTTSGIFGPVVKEGSSSAQYRAAFDPDSDSFAQRIHYQQAFNDDLQWRLLAQIKKTTSDSTDLDFIRGELTWQLSQNDSDWQYGFRFDYRINDGDRPDSISANFTNQFKISPKLSARAILLTRVDLGSDAEDGVFLGTRARFRYRLNESVQTGLEMFSSYGSTEDLRGANEQRHQIGPYAIVKLPNRWQATFSILGGLTDSTPDTNLRLFLGRSF